MTSVNVTENKYSVSVTEGATTVVTVKAPGPQGVQGATGATGAGISAGDKGALTVAANLTDWTLNDSVVTNAKVASDAAIAGSKISPDFGSQNITTTGNAVFGGNLTVSGTTTTIDTTTLRVEDKNIELGKVGSPTDTTADGGGITLLGDTNHTFNWINATDSWTSSEHIALPDNKKLQLGDSQDFLVFHDGSNGLNYIQAHNNGPLIFKANSDNLAKFIPDGAVELYYDSSKKFETTSTGVTISGNLFTGHITAAIDGNTSISLQDTGHGLPQTEIKLSNGGRDLNIVAPVDIRLFPQGGENGIVIEGNGQVELYHDNVKKFETTSVGAEVTGGLDVTGNIRIPNATGKLQLNQNLNIYRDNNHGYIDHAVGALKIRSDTLRINDLTNDHSMIHADADGAVKLYHDNVLKAQTSSNGFDLPDNSKLQLGDSQDLQLFHDGSQSVILDNGTGQLRISGENTIALTNAAGTESYARFVANDTAQLFHNNVVRLSTTGIGVTVSGKITSTGDIIINSDYPVLSFVDTNNDSDYRLTNANGNFLLYDISNAATRFTVTNAGLLKVHGNVEPEADNTRALGSSSKRFTTLHSAALNTGDINMSNLNDNGNEVDGSKGSWTLQEGANDLFLINRVSGKKYKFNLTEIS